MNTGERQIEAAEQNVAMETEAGVAKIRALLSAAGDEDCMDCGDPIGVERRMALPSATRCIQCQEALERTRGNRRNRGL